jgi:hypothetical protein
MEVTKFADKQYHESFQNLGIFKNLRNLNAIGHAAEASRLAETSPDSRIDGRWEGRFPDKVA